MLWLPGDPLPVERDSERFRCPVCGRVHAQREPMEPVCTGPSWTDDHEPTPMVGV